MKVEFLDNIDGDGKYPDADPKELIRIYEFDSPELGMLKAGFLRLADGIADAFNISELAFVKEINCELLFVVGDSEFGVPFEEDSQHFICTFPRLYYYEVVDIIERLGHGYN